MDYQRSNTPANNSPVPRKVKGWRATFLMSLLASVCFIAIILAVRPAHADNPNFTTQHSFGIKATVVTVGDVDGDGKLDIIAFTGSPYGGSGQNEIYLNDGSGNFPSIRRFGTGSDSTKSLAVGDVDGDGNLDIVAGNYGQSVVYLNDGAGNFYYGPVTCGSTATVRCFGTGADTTQSVAAGDMDGDGDLDIVVGNDAQQSAIYLNDGVGNFYSGPVTCGVIAGVRCFGADLDSTQSVAIGDIDSDGDLDIAAGKKYSEQSVVYLNDGAGTFYTGSATCDIAMGVRCFGSPSDGARSLVVADIDSDRDLDLIADRNGQGEILYLNDGMGNFPNGTVTYLNSGSGRTLSVAVGDIDSDGDLDLAVGTDEEYFYHTQLILVYINNGAGHFTLGSNFGTLLDKTTSIALADMNGDGNLDVVAANGITQNFVYLNNGAGSLPVESTVDGGTRNVVLADVDGDGDLDLAAGDSDQSAIYLNDGTGHFPRGPNQCDITPGVHCLGIAAGSYGALSIAAGDVNGDGAVDFALGYSGRQDIIYLNDGAGNFHNGSFTCGSTPRVRCFGSAAYDTQSVAFADVDGDGDLDIAIGAAKRYDNNCQCNVGGQSAIYLNDGTGNFYTGVVVCGFTPGVRCFGSTADNTQSVAIGDIDNDGDLDLIVGAYGQSTVYLNDGDGNFPIRRNFGAATDRTRRVVVGDLDGDGALDIVAGIAISNPIQQNAVYLNDGAGHFSVGRRFGPLENDTDGVAVGDIDGDSDLDIVVANGIEDLAKPNMVYLNDGNGNFSIGRTMRSTDYATADTAVGDLDRDGDNDIVVGLRYENDIQLNGLNGSARLASNPPRVVLARPGPTSDANFFSTPTILSSPTISITYTLSDPEGDPVRLIRTFYSTNGGGRWLPATAASGTITTNLTTSPSGVIHLFTWDTFADGFFGQSDNVVFRIEAYPSYQTPGPFQRPYTSATTFPFRVRGTQVRVLRQDGTPAVGAEVYRLPKGQARSAQPLASGGLPFHTDSQGYLQGRGELKIGDKIVALLPITATDTYTLYYTSATPTASGLSATTVLTPGVQTLTVSPANPLVLFNLDVSLEWDARKDTQFLTQLHYDLKRTAELLYDWTNGQAALGRITLYHDKQHWNDAHLRIYATNRMRPNAVQGGIVTSVITDPVSLRANNPVLPAITYAPGQVRVGPSWNRYGDPGSNLGEDWPRALAHELGHFALFLDDNYLGLDANGLLAPVDTCPGAMSDPYRDDYSEFHPTEGWISACGGTLSQQSTGRADWSTIATFYPWLHAPTIGTDFTHVLTGPVTLPLEVAQIQEALIMTPSVTVDAPIFLLSRDNQRVQPGATARAFLFQDDPDDAGTEVDRLIDLGRPTLDQLLARGARVGDRLCLYELVAQRLGCTTVSASDRQLTLQTTSTWQPDLTITPVTSRTLSLAVQGISETLALQAQLFPLNDPALPPITLTRTTSGSYTGTITSPPDRDPPLEGYVHVWVNEPEPRREVVTDYALRGNPGSKWARAPRGSPGSKWARAPIISSDGQVILFGDDLNFPEETFYTLQAASILPAAPSWATVVGQAYRLSASANAPPLQGTSISFNYLGSEAPPGEEAGLRVYYWNGSTWQQLPTALDLYHNTASAPAQGAGIYVLMSSVVLPLGHAGWNLVAYPAPGKQPMPAALASIDGHYTTVYGYDPTDTANPWKVYDTGVKPPWAPLVNDLTELEYGHGYWINVTEPITALLKGGTTPSLLDDNAIGGLTLPPATYYGIVPGVVPTASLKVQARVNGHLCGETETQSLTIDGKAQVVFVVDVRAAGPGADTGCGTPGQPITIAFLDSSRELSALITPWDNERVHELIAGPHRLYVPLIARAQ